MQDLIGWGFEGLLSRTAVHAVARMGKTRGQRNKRNFTRRDIRNTRVPDLVDLLV
jgi:hypothetical protein